MPVAMRLMRMGTTHHPVYRISIGDSRKRPTAKFIEHIGTYNPTPDKMGHKQLRLNVARAKYWIAMGCQPSSIVSRLLSRFHLLPVPPARITVPTGPLLHRVLAGEDVRKELEGGQRVYSPEEIMLPHRLPLAKRRFGEISEKRLEALQQQAPWKLQAFDFDPAPTPATWATWDQARRFHGHQLASPQHKAAPALSFREKLKAAEARALRMQQREEDAREGRDRSTLQGADDEADDAAEILWQRELAQAAGKQPRDPNDKIVIGTIEAEEQLERQIAKEHLAKLKARRAERAADRKVEREADREHLTEEENDALDKQEALDKLEAEEQVAAEEELDDGVDLEAEKAELDALGKELEGEGEEFDMIKYRSNLDAPMTAAELADVEAQLAAFVQKEGKTVEQFVQDLIKEDDSSKPTKKKQ